MRYLSIFLMLFASLSCLGNNPPSWIKKLPKAENGTYVYMVQRGDGYSEEEAFEDALHRLNRRVAYKMGLPFTSRNVSIYSRDHSDPNNEPVEVYNIPINHVCDYTEFNKGEWHVYILCQVAINGEIEPEFEEYRSCGCNSAYLGQESKVVIPDDRPDMPRGHEYHRDNAQVANQFGVHTRRIIHLKNQ